MSNLKVNQISAFTGTTVDVSGSFTVNGVPISDVTSSLALTASYADTLTIGGGSLLKYSENTSLNTSSTIVSTITTGSYKSAFFEYSLTSGSNSRAGSIMSSFNNGSVVYNEVSTQDIGTVNITMSVAYDASNNIVLYAVPNAGSWVAKSLIKLI